MKESLQKRKLKLLFLYSELADYFLACLEELHKLYDVEIHVIHWPVNKEAPFQFQFPVGIQFYEKNSFPGDKLAAKVKEISPDFIYCSGWMDNDYLAVAKNHTDKIPVVIGLDTKWEGKLRQYTASLLSRFTIRRIFTHCWVPGMQQRKYALKLGFREDQIMTGYYTANVDYFNTIGDISLKEKSRAYPYRFIYVGRYYEFKGVTDLWNAFIAWKEKTKNDWELWCLGTGDVQPIEHPAIKHFGFIQPKDIGPFIQQTGVFVMPSKFEPWGVVLHEFAAAGFPLICSDKVGAVEAFVNNEENGYIYRAGNTKELAEILDKMARLSDGQLLEMGAKSRQLASAITPAKWAHTLMNIIQQKI